MPPPPRPPVSSRDALVDLAERQTPRAIYVVSLLTAVAAFSLAVMRLPDARRPAAVAARAPLRSVSVALARYADENGRLPDELDDLLVGWIEGAASLDDAWGQPILYARTGGGDALLVSLGADGRDGGGGDDRDVVVRVSAPSRGTDADRAPR